MESPGALPPGGLILLLVCPFHRYWAFSSKSTVWPKMVSCFQDRACPVSSFTNNYPHPKSPMSYPSTSIFCSLKTPSLVLPQGLWYCCFCCLKCPLSRPVHLRLILIQFSVQMMPHHWDHPWPHQPKHSPYNVMLWPLTLVCCLYSINHDLIWHCLPFASCVLSGPLTYKSSETRNFVILPLE